MGQEYGIGEEEINKMFVEVSCSKSKLMDILKG